MTTTETDTFPVLETTDAVSEKWREIERGRRDLSEWDRRLWEAIEGALDAGLYYNRDVDEFVHARIPTNPEQLRYGTGEYLESLGKRAVGVEGGCFGYEIYHCRREIERRRELAKRLKAAERIKPGMIFKNVRLPGHIISTATITGVTDAGMVCFDGKKRGSPRGWKATVSAMYFADLKPE